MVSIPQTVFTKYSEFADAMMSDFGTSCKLVYVDKIEVLSNGAVPNPKQRKLMNIHDSADGGFNRGSTSFKTVEVTEDITLRVYWDKKDFKRFGNIEVPDGSIMTIGHYADMLKVNRATSLLIATNITGHAEWKFTKNAEPIIHGLDQDYFMCFWSRS